MKEATHFNKNLGLYFRVVGDEVEFWAEPKKEWRAHAEATRLYQNQPHHFTPIAKQDSIADATHRGKHSGNLYKIENGQVSRWLLSDCEWRHSPGMTEDYKKNPDVFVPLAIRPQEKKPSMDDEENQWRYMVTPRSVGKSTMNNLAQAIKPPLAPTGVMPSDLGGIARAPVPTPKPAPVSLIKPAMASLLVTFTPRKHL